MNTAITTPKPLKTDLLSRPRGIIFATGLIIALWILMRGNLLTLVLISIVVLFIIGIKKPLWAVVALLVSQLTVASYMVSTPIGDISLRLLLQVLTLFVLGGAFARREINLGPATRKLIVPILLLMAVAIISDVVNVGFSTAFKDFRSILSGLLFIILMTAVIKDNKQLKNICGITCIIITASATIGIMQHFNILGMNQASLQRGFVIVTNRVPGMGETELELAYILPVAALVACGIFMKRGISSINRGLLVVSMVLMVLGLWFTYTRSGLLALGFGLASVLLYLKTRINWQIIFVLSFILIGLLANTDLAGNLFLGGRTENAQTESSVARVILQQASIAVALDHPVLGIGGGQFTTISPQYADSVDPSLLDWEAQRYWSYRTLGKDQPHNDFLMIWLSYGTIALALYLWLFFVVLHNCFRSFRASKNHFIKGLSLGIASALATYVANSFYHNLIVDLPLFWTLAAFSLVATKLAAKERETQLPQTLIDKVNK